MSGFIQRITQKVLLSLFAVAMAFGQSEVVISAPPYYGVMSGTYTISGYALAASASVTSVQVTLSPFSGYAHYGDPTTGVCQNFSGWVGCNTGNVGWDLTVDTTTLTQGPGGISAIAALSAGQGTNWANIPDVTVDQPPTIQLTSTPPAGAGSGTFTFTATASMGAGFLQSINGWISQTFGSTPACAFSYQPGSSALGLLGDDGSSWQWADDGSDLSNSECDIGGYSSYNSSTGVLTLNITFFSGLQGPQYIWLDATDSWLDSGWQAGIPWYAVPVVSGFAPASGAAGTRVTISGSGFGASQGSGTVTFDGVAAANVTPWGPGSISANVPVGAMTGPIAVTVGGVTATSSGNFTVPVTSPAVSIDTLPAVLSGTLTMSGWAVDSAALINPNSLQISIGSSVIGTGPYFYYGYSRPDACSGQYQNWPGCPNVGWMDQLIDTTQLTQGPNQLLTVSAVTQGSSPVTGAAQSTVVVDQPLFAMGLPPSTSRGNGVFSFEVWSEAWSPILDPQWISGWIASGLNKTPACAFTYWPDSGALALLDDTGSQWQWGTLGSVMANSECRIEADSSYTTTSGRPPMLLLNLDITFLAGLQGNVQIWADAADEWLDAGWYSEETWNTVSPPPTILSFTPASAMANQQLTISGRNFITAQGTCGTVSLGGSQVPPANISTCTETSIVLTVPANAASGYVGVTVGSSTGQSSSSFTFQYFTMGSPSPTSITVQPGSSSTFSEVFAGFNSYNSTVQLSYSGGPSGLTFSPSSVLVSGVVNQAITATAAPGTAFGTYTIMIAASGTSTLRTLTVVVAPPPPVLSMDPLPAVISGWYQMSGWAVDGLTAIDPNSVQISVLGYSPAIVVGNATYGNFRSDMCTGQYQGWPGCPDVGWTYGFNASPSSVPQGNQTLQITAATLGPVPVTGSIQVATVIDDPPNLNFAPPASNSGSGAFTLTVTTDSAAETASLQWINGVIGPSLYGPPQCMFSYWPNYGALALLNDAGTAWVWGGLDPGLSNSNCQISATAASGLGNSISSDGLTDTLTLNITFLAGLPGGTNEQIWATTSDANVGTDWEEFATNYDTNVGEPAVSGFSPGSAPQGTPLTISGSNFGAAPGTVSLGGVQVPPANITSWSASTVVLTVPANAASGPVLVATGNGSASSGTPFQFVPADFTMSQPSPSTIAAYQTGAQSGSFTDVIGGVNFSGPISLSYSVAPAPTAGSLTFTPSSLSSPGAFTATATALYGTPQGTYTVTITAKGTRLDGTIISYSVTVSVVVTGPPTITMGPPSPSPVVVSSNQAVTFTQTVTASNGFTGEVDFTVPLNRACWGGTASLTPAMLSAASPSQTVTGTITPISPGSSVTVYSCVVDAYPGAYTMVVDGVPVQVYAGPTVTVSGPPAITLNVGSAGVPVNLQVAPVNGFSNYVTFTTSTANVTVQAPSVVVSAPTTIPVTVQWTAGTLPNLNPVPITILANGQPVFTIMATVAANPTTTFTITSSPGSQSTNSSGGATFQINVNAASTFAGNVSFNVTGLPAGSWSLVPPTVTGAGVTALIVTPPAVTTATVYTIGVTGTSGGTSAPTAYSTLTVNPPGASAPATMLLPQPSPENSNPPILPLYYPTYTWTKAIKADKLALSVGRLQGGTDFGSTTIPDPSTTSFTQQTRLPGDGSKIWVRLGTLINGSWQNYDYSYTSDCRGRGDDDVPPSVSTLESDVNIAAVENNGLPVSYTFTPNASNGYYFTVGQGCSATSNGQGVTAVPSYSDTGGPGEDPDFTVTFQANETAASGTWTVTCNWVSPTLSAWPPLVTSTSASPPLSTLVLQVYDATPQISHAGTSEGQLAVPYDGDPEAVLLTITGSNFGSWGQVAFCPTSGPACSSSNPAGDGQISYTIDTWSPGLITAWITAGQNAGTSYDVMVISNGVNGLGTGYLLAGAQTTSRSSGQKTAANPTPPLMKLQMANPTNPTIVSDDGLYSENTAISVTAVRADGSTLAQWTGTAYVAESADADYVQIYSQNGGTLCVGCTSVANADRSGVYRVAISQGGTAEFLAKSLAGPVLASDPTQPNSAPEPAVIETTNYPLYMNSPLNVPQWVSNAPQDLRSTGSVYDWVKARAEYLFANPTGDPDLQTVLGAVSSYSLGTRSPAGNVTGGYENLSHAKTGSIVINPYFTNVRLDGPSGPTCGHTDSKTFTYTLYHEARHAYQGALSVMPNAAGVCNPNAAGVCNGNDADQDYLVNNVPIAPTTTLIDSAAVRNVCNEATPVGGTIQTAHYLGDTIPDPYGDDTNPCPTCNYVLYALEEDAHAFASSKAGP